MKRDTIFYTFFQQSPKAIFDLLPNPPKNAGDYRFDAVSVKEAKFEMDGVFLPPDDARGTVYFCEVQMQKILDLYERLFAEAFLYFRQNRSRFTDWQMIVIYPSRSTEQDDVHPWRAILSSAQMHRIYLDELGDVRQLPIWIGLMVLTIVNEAKMAEDARALIERARQGKTTEEKRVIIELVATVVSSYKFQKLSLQEIQEMLDLSVEEPRFFKDLRQVERQEGLQEGQAALIIRQLTKRFEELPETVSTRVHNLSISNLEKLGEAILDFSSLAEAQDWLKGISAEGE